MTMPPDQDHGHAGSLERDPGSDGRRATAAASADRLRGLLDTGARAAEDAAALAAADAVSGALVVSGDGSAADSKRSMALVRAEALKKKAELDAIEREMKAELEARLAEMRAAAAPLIAQVKRMEEGIWTLNLYLGRDEEIVAIRDNQNLPAADPDEPFTLRQEVLTMDEETAAHAESGGIDARNLDVFDAWIAEPDNLNRTLPERKGVVALVPRRRGRDYGDPWMQRKMEDANRWTYFLIRNGERVWRMSTEFVVGKHLTPTVAEFTSLFTSRRYDSAARGYVHTPIEPGTQQWADAEKAQDAKQRHYMRVALVLQGLIDRTPVFHPLPDGGINLLDQRTYDEGRAVMVRDAEAGLTDGRPEFGEWLRSKMKDLRPGMRVMGAFHTSTFREAGGEYEESTGRGPGFYHPNDRISPRARSSYAADKPADATLYTLDKSATLYGVHGFTFKFERKKRWIDHEHRVPKARATCLVTPGDTFVLPFDLVTADECRYYLASRRNRHAYEEMFPLLKACIEAKEAEAAEEAPFRRLLAAALVHQDARLATEGVPGAGALADASASDADLVAAHQTLDGFVDWWKLKNSIHRSLAANERQAISDIVSEFAARLRGEDQASRDSAAETAMVARLLDPALGGDPTIMVIGRTRDGGYLAFAPQPRTYPAAPQIGAPARNVPQPAPMNQHQLAVEAAKHPVHRLDDPEAARRIPGAVADNVWAREYTTTKTGRTVKVRDWVQPGLRMDRTRILHSTPAWDALDLHANALLHLTDPEIDAVLTEVVPEVESLARGGWPTRWKSDSEAPFEPTLLGVCLRSGATGEVTDGGLRVEVHLADLARLAVPAGPDGEPTAPSATGDRSDDKPSTGVVRISVTKRREGLHVARHRHTGAWDIEWSSSRYSTAPVERPWHYFWSGRARHAIALVEFPDAQRSVAERVARILAFNAEVDRLRATAARLLWFAKRADDARTEAQVYDRFLDDYADPDLWAGHRKTLKDTDLTTSWHPMGRDCPAIVREIALRAVDAGVVEALLAGTDQHTIGSLAVVVGLDPAAVPDSFRDLPVHAPGPDA